MRLPLQLISVLVSAFVLLAAPTLAQPSAPPTPAPAAPPAADEPAKPPSLGDSLTGMAKAEYAAGRILFADGDFDNAIVKFLSAYQLSSDPRLLWNIAVCQKELRQYSKMLTSVRLYVKLGDLSDAKRQRADEIVKTVRGFVSQFQLQVDQPGADVVVDGERIGVTPLPEHTTLDVGKRHIEIRKDGYEPHVSDLTAPGGQTVALVVRLRKEIHRGRLLIAAGTDHFIRLDGVMVGRGTWEGTLRSGSHTLRVTAPGKLPHQSEVVVADDSARRIEVALVDEGVSTSTIVWIVGGVSLAAVAAVSSAVLYEPASPDKVQGTIPPGSVQLGATVIAW